jgi:ATP-dependent DNA helicase RecQ
MSNEIETVARDTFGWESLRPGQREAIEAVTAGTDTLAVMPTGYGKSAIYQLAGVLLEGPTVVVSPLISLQFDQIAGLNEHPDAPDAVAINSGQADGKNAEAWQQLREGEAEFVFLSPEQLAMDEVVERLRKLEVRLFVVDEAHCVSAWGHDFRPDYLQLAEVIGRLGHPTVLALTATGSPPVREEIVRRLDMRNAAVLTRGFDRPNLRLEVVRHESDARKRATVVDRLAELPRPGLAYVATRKDTERYADELVERGIRGRAYHAGQAASVRRDVQQQFRDDETDVVVATNAFGMGIDKPNVRFVLHAAVPDSLDSYYQEVGRAGRDGEDAVVELHYRAEDLGLRTFFASGIPSHADLRRAFEALASHDEPVRLPQLAAELDVQPRSLSRLTNLLQQAGVVTSSRRGLRARPGTDADTAAGLAVESAEERERIEQSRIAMMRAYAETRQCRRQFLLGYFGEELAEPCGNCDTCSDGSAFEENSAEVDDDEFAVDTPVRHTEWGDGTVMRTEDDRITVFFESEGYKVLSRVAVVEKDLLKPA